MEIEFAIIADYAATTQDNKLVIGGVFDSIYAQEMPASHPYMALAIRVRAHPGEAGRHAVMVRLVGPDGGEVVQPLEAQIEVGGLDPLEGGTADLVMQLAGVPFETFGRHSFDVFIDGRFERGVMLSVRRAPDAPGSGRGPEDGSPEGLAPN